MTRSSNKFDQKGPFLMSSILIGVLIRRKRFYFQILKQFILFPDESDSSSYSISKYDKLIFSDQ